MNNNEMPPPSAPHAPGLRAPDAEAPVPAQPAVVALNLKSYDSLFGVYHPFPGCKFLVVVGTADGGGSEACEVSPDSVCKETPSPEAAAWERKCQKIAYDALRKWWPAPHPFGPPCIPLLIPAVRDMVPLPLPHIPNSKGIICMEYIPPLRTHLCKQVLTQYFSPTGRAEDSPLTNEFWQKQEAVTRGLEFRFRLQLGDILGYNQNMPQEGAYQHFRASYDFLKTGGRDPCQYASMMGQALAILHWSCRLDGRGVKFLLSGDQRGSYAVYLTDFGHCRDIPYPTQLPRTGDPAKDKLSRKEQLDKWVKSTAEITSGAIQENPSFPRRLCRLPRGLPEGTDIQDFRRYQFVWEAFELTYRRASEEFLTKFFNILHPRTLIDETMKRVSPTPWHWAPLACNAAAEPAGAVPSDRDMIMAGSGLPASHTLPDAATVHTLYDPPEDWEDQGPQEDWKITLGRCLNGEYEEFASRWCLNDEDDAPPWPDFGPE